MNLRSISMSGMVIWSSLYVLGLFAGAIQAAAPKASEREAGEATAQRSSAATTKIRKTTVGLFVHTWHDEAASSGVMGETPYTTGMGWWWWGRPAYFGGDLSEYRWTTEGGNPQTDFIDYQLDLIEKLDVNFIYLDATNGTQVKILNGIRSLCQRRQERKKGPKIVLWIQKKEDLPMFHREFYSKYDSEIFFIWKKKPLLMIAGTSDGWQPNPNPKPLPRGGVFDKYTVRWCWGLLGSNAHSMWSFKDLSAARKPYLFGGKPEQMSVAVACQASHMTTAGDGRRGRENGNFLAEQAARVATYRPQIVCIHSWNEWMAIKFGNDPNNPQFVDLFGTEYSADIEPMQGGHGALYYQKVQDYILSLP